MGTLEPSKTHEVRRVAKIPLWVEYGLGGHSVVAVEVAGFVQVQATHENKPHRGSKDLRNDHYHRRWETLPKGM